MESQARTTMTRFAENFVSVADPRASRRKNKIFHSLGCEFQTSYKAELWGGDKKNHHISSNWSLCIISKNFSNWNRQECGFLCTTLSLRQLSKTRYSKYRTTLNFDRGADLKEDSGRLEEQMYTTIIRSAGKLLKGAEFKEPSSEVRRNWIIPDDYANKFCLAIRALLFFLGMIKE